MKLQEAVDELMDYVTITEGLTEFAIDHGLRILVSGGATDENKTLQITPEAIEAFPLEQKDVEGFRAFEAAMLGNLKLSRIAFAKNGIYVKPAVDIVKEIG